MPSVLTRLFAVAALLAAAGCVNEYVYGEGSSTGQGSTGSTALTPMTSGPSGASESSGIGSNSGSAGDSTGSDPTGSSSTGGSSSSGGSSSDTTEASGGDSPAELCQGPCATDAECGGPTDLCVLLARGQEPVCLRACGRSCPGDVFSCAERTSVEGSSALQCVPDGNVCP